MTRPAVPCPLKKRIKLGLPLAGVGTVPRLERAAWSMTKRLNQATNEYAPPPAPYPSSVCLHFPCQNLNNSRKVIVPLVTILAPPLSKPALLKNMNILPRQYTCISPVKPRSVQKHESSASSVCQHPSPTKRRPVQHKHPSRSGECLPPLPSTKPLPLKTSNCSLCQDACTRPAKAL